MTLERDFPVFFVHVKPPPPTATITQLTMTNVLQVVQELEIIARSYLLLKTVVDAAGPGASPESIQALNKMAAKLQAFRDQIPKMESGLPSTGQGAEMRTKFHNAVESIFAKLGSLQATSGGGLGVVSGQIARGGVSGGLGKPLGPVNSNPHGAAAIEGRNVTDDVLTFEFDEDEQKIDQCKITVNNQDNRYLDEPIFQRGAVLTVSWGYGGRMTTPREVIVQKSSGGRVLTIEAQGETVLMNKQVRSRTFEGLTRSQIVRQVAEENGYGPLEQDIEETTVVRPHTLQAQLTDAQFLRRLADLEGFEFYIDGLGLHWHRRRMGQKPIRILQYYLPPNVGDIVDYTIEADIFAKIGAVVLNGRDPITKKNFSAVSGFSTDGVISASTTGAAKGATSGGFGSEEHTSLGAVPEVRGPLPKQGAGGSSGHIKIGIDPISGQLNVQPDDTIASSETAPTSAQDAAGAKALADAKHLQTQQSAITFSIDIVGDPDLPVKTIVDVRGIGKRLSGLYYVSGHQHSISNGKYSGKLRVRSDGTNGSGQPATAATKSNVNTQSADGSDPKGLGTKITIDPITGEIKTTYHDDRGQGAPQGAQQ